jgi:hypothetical protein
MKRLLILAGMLASFVLGMAAPAFTFQDHPNMRNARGHLFQAREWLEKAHGIRFGRREKALEHVNKAIDECDQGIADR